MLRNDQDDPTSPLRAVLCVLMGMLLASGHSLAQDPVVPLLGSPDVLSPGIHSTDKRVIVPLFTKASLQKDDWVFVSRDKSSQLADTWQVVPGANDDDPILVCKGTPYGYLRTNRQYDEFEMELEWRYPMDENGNSGVLLYTSDEDKVWPNAIQVQLHQPVAGSIFASGDAKTDNEIRDVRDAALPVNQWNVCRISSTGGTITVEMNGKKIGSVTGCRPNKGWIALQSEGSEIHFRHVIIRETPPVAAPMPQGDQTGWLNSPTVPWNGPCDCNVAPQWVSTNRSRRSQRHQKRHRKVSYVVYRNTLATDRHPGRGRRRLRLDVAGPPTVMVAGGNYCLHGAECWCAGF